MFAIKIFIKKYVNESSFLLRAYRYFKYRHIPPGGSLDQTLEEFSKANANALFIQIGSNDGQSGDPLYKYIQENEWKGVLVEPLKYLFLRLIENYKEAKSELYFENSAIAQKKETAFYYLKEDGRLPPWYEQLSSFKYDLVKSYVQHLPNGEDLIAVESVSFCSFQELLDKYQINRLDLLHIDAEGYDFEILKMIAFDKIKPGLIIFEHKHLSIKEYKSAIRLLRNNGYSLSIDKGDTICTNQ